MASIIDGFDLYNGFAANNGGFLEKWVWSSTTSGRAFVAGRFGGQCLRIADGSGNNGAARRNIPAPSANFSIHVAYNNLNLLAGNPFLNVLDSAAALQLSLEQRADGSIVIYRGTTQIGITAIGILSANTWATIEFFGTIDNAAGTCELWVNDAQVFTFSGDTQQTANANWQWVQLVCPDASGTNNYAYFDDLWVRDVASRPGLQRVDICVPNADTADKDWVASTGSDNYACVDEAPAAVADYVQGSVVGDLDLYSISTLGTIPASIADAQVVVLASKTDAGSRSIALVADDGTQQQSADIPLIASVMGWAYMPMPTMPDGSPLNYADLSSLKIGPKVTV